MACRRAGQHIKVYLLFWRYDEKCVNIEFFQDFVSFASFSIFHFKFASQLEESRFCDVNTPEARKKELLEIVMNELRKIQICHFDLQIHPTLLNSTYLHCDNIMGVAWVYWIIYSRGVVQYIQRREAPRDILLNPVWLYNRSSHIVLSNT